jgi:hypothetical protein
MDDNPELAPTRNTVTTQHTSKGNSTMAKGQKRSNREIRKPKQPKVATKPENTFASQIKNAANGNAPRLKSKH